MSPTFVTVSVPPGFVPRDGSFSAVVGAVADFDSYWIPG
jgi:hypothetical protein